MNLSRPSPDLSDHLVHFTGRARERPELPPAIRKADAPGRLASILGQGVIRAFRPYDRGALPVVCFTESTPDGLGYLIAEKGFHPWGLAFRRDWVYGKGGGPVFYFTGQDARFKKGLPLSVRSKMVKYMPEQGVDWTHEREWPIPFEAGEEGLVITPDDVHAIVVPVTSWPGPTSEVEVDGLPRHVYPDWYSRWQSTPIWYWDGARLV